MTTSGLARLLRRRRAAWDAMNASGRTIGRAEGERFGAENRAANAAIVAELRQRTGPVRLPSGETLWLTKDLLDFVVVQPSGAPAGSIHGDWRRLVLRYPLAGAAS